MNTINEDHPSGARFAVCVDNAGNEASLEIGKLYEVLPDDQAAQHGYLRMIDESGEDYWHAAEMFYVLKLPRALAVTLRNAYHPA